MAGIAELTLARNGARVALVYPTYPQARDEFEHLAELATDAAKLNGSSGRLRIDFESGGLIRIVANADQLRGFDFGQVLVHPDAWSEEAAAVLAGSVATTGGVVRIFDAPEGVTA